MIFAAGAGWYAADLYFSRRWYGEAKDAAGLRRKYAVQSSRPATARPRDSQSNIRFVDDAKDMGIDFVYDDGANGDFLLVETMGGGMAVADFDRDGRLDVFFPNSCRLPLNLKTEHRRSALFLRVGATGSGGRFFSECAPNAGLGIRCYAQGASAADFNQDGFDDLLVTGFQVIQLFRNQGDGTFVRSPLPTDSLPFSLRWWTSAAWFDADDDGNLDLYVCAYATVDPDNPRLCRVGNLRTHCHPRSYPPESDVFLRNNGDGRFSDATDAFGFTEHEGRGLGVAVADFSGSGKPSIYVANDTSSAYLWVRGEGGRPAFTNHAAALGVELTAAGAAMAGMGVAVGDFDRNGFLDFFITDFFEAGGNLFANLGSQGFVPKSAAVGLLAPTRQRLGFGAAFIDADLDGWPDLVIANGHVTDQSSLGIPYRMRAQIFRNENGRRFADVSGPAGEFFHRLWLGRGLATGDFDDDGRPDFVVSNMRDHASLLFNRTTPCGNWIGFDFIGRRCARGVRNVNIEVRHGGVVNRHHQISGGGYLSSSDSRVLLGLANQNALLDEVIVNWPSGTRQSLKHLAPNRYHLVLESLWDAK